MALELVQATRMFEAKLFNNGSATGLLDIVCLQSCVLQNTELGAMLSRKS
jgi:hypothetical protein